MGLQADGFFGDTISSSGLQEFFDDALANGHPTAIQPEAGGTTGSMNFTSMYGTTSLDGIFVERVSPRFRFFEWFEWFRFLIANTMPCHGTCRVT